VRRVVVSEGEVLEDQRVLVLRDDRLPPGIS
jgi:hypothetical protein